MRSSHPMMMYRMVSANPRSSVPKSNEKRIKEERNELIEIDSKYFETEKQSSEDLEITRKSLKAEIEKVKELINNDKKNVD